MYNTGLAPRNYGNSAWTPEAIRQGVQQIGDDPNTIYRKAMENGISGQQLDSAMGWGAGTANGYAGQQGYAPLNGTPQGPYMANAAQASNEWIGNTTGGISGAPSVMPYAQGSRLDNPYLGGTSGNVSFTGATASANPMAGMNNPALQGAIDAASEDVTRNFNLTTRPQLDAQMQASGSFGNTGVQQMQGEAQRGLARELGNVSSGMRMQDYQLQAQLAEAAANRATQTSQFNASNNLGAQTTNAGLRSGDLSRNLAGYNTQEGMNTSNLLGAAQFDSGNTLRAQEGNAGLQAGDLARNSQLAQGLGTFNAGQTNAAGMFNAGQGNSRYQFDENLDYGIDNTNWNRQRTGTQDQISLINSLMGINTQGLSAANGQADAPLNYLRDYASLVNSIAGQGGTQSQTQDGNWLMGLLGGALSGSQLWK